MIRAVHRLVPSRGLTTGREALRAALAEADTVEAAVAFVTASGVRLLGEIFEEAGTPSTARIVARGAPVSDPDAVRALAELGLEVRVVMGELAPRFHPKLWVTTGPHGAYVLSGSGNLTEGGLQDNVEQFELLRLPLQRTAREVAAHRARFARYFALGAPLAEAVRSPAWTAWVEQQAARKDLATKVRKLDLKLARKRAPRPAGLGFARGSAPSVALTWAISVLQDAVGDGYVAELSSSRWGQRAQVDVGTGRGFQLIFLVPGPSRMGWPKVHLEIYPADTLSQAKVLYPQLDAPTRRLLLDLSRVSKWNVGSNFHVGVRRSGHVHDGSPTNLRRYVDYWQANLGEHRQRDQQDWGPILRRLANAGAVSRGYPNQFETEIGRRSPVAPRPGLKMTRTWSQTEVADLEQGGRLSGAVREAVEEALRALGERPL
jgi:HKD family nuclease